MALVYGQERFEGLDEVSFHLDYPDYIGLFLQFLACLFEFLLVFASFALA